MTLKHYTGNKAMPGLWQFIINRIPPHDLYFELFAGSGAIARILPGTARKILVDINGETITALRNEIPTAECVQEDAISILQSFLSVPPAKWSVQSNATVPPGGSFRKIQSKVTVRTRENIRWPVQTEMTVPARKIMIYADPPYMFSTRRGKRNLYKYEMTDTQHLELVRAFSTVKANCMISHPENDLYDNYLQGWTKEKFKVSYHGHIVDECIYYNYKKPEELQTYDYVGADCWDRQRVKRKIERLARKLAELPALERNAVIARAIK